MTQGGDERSVVPDAGRLRWGADFAGYTRVTTVVIYGFDLALARFG